MIAGLQPEVKDVEALGIGGGLEDLLLVGQHVEDRDVRSAIVVEVGGVDAHREPAGVPGGLGDRLGEGAVAVVEVEEIVLLKVVRDVQIGAAIEVQIARDDAQAESFDAAVDARLLAHIHEVAAVVSEEAISRPRRALGAGRPPTDGPLGVGRVVQEIHVQVAVAVVVEEEGLGGSADVVEPVFLRAVGEGPVAVVDVEHIVPVHREIADGGHVDVDPPVPVDIGHRDAGLPALGIRHARLLGHVLEPVVPLVQVKPIGPPVRGEVEIGQAVVVHVADGHAAAVVVVQVVEDVERRVFGEPVDKRDAGPLGWQQLEQGGTTLGAMAAGQDRHARTEEERRPARDAKHSGRRGRDQGAVFTSAIKIP